VVANRSNAEDYRLSQDSMRCYAKFHGYQLLEVDISQNDTWQRICPQKDFMFQRHCITVQILNGLPSSSWLLFIDADIGIINPNRLIEEFLDPSIDLIFYDRTFNFEIMAGSYLTKKTNFSLQFLQYWANYEFHLPNSVHGTDNGAIQMVFMDLLLPSLQFSEREKCARIWEKSRDYHDLFVFEACARRVLASVNGSWPGRVKVLAKGEAWCRDGWLTSAMWSPGDFMFHGWQKRRMDRLEFAGWPSPFVSNVFNMSLCDTNQAYKNWRYKDSFIRTTNEIELVLTREKALANRDYQRALAEIHWKPFDLNNRSW